MLKNWMWRHNALRSSVVSIALVATTGCLTTESGSKRDHGNGVGVKPSRTTLGLKSPTIAPPAPPKETSRPAAGQAPLILAPVPDSQIADFASRHALSVARLSETDEQLLRRIPNQPQPGSIQEAAMVLGIVKALNPVNTDAKTFKESELNGDLVQKLNLNAPTETAANAGGGLEKAALTRGLDVPGAIDVNPFLQSASVVRMVALAADKGGNSEAFTKRLRAALAKQVNEWRDLSDRYGRDLAVVPMPPTPNLVPTSTLTPNDSMAPTGDAARAIIEGTGDVSDLHSSDLVINEAVRQSDEGQFDKAIETLKRVQKDSPLYKVSQDKTQEFANTAVRDMRRKAAQAFSTANQANDPGTKGSYLDKAKTILEDALKKYPDADQLGTVRENLTVINRDLDRLRSSPPQRK